MKPQATGMITAAIIVVIMAFAALVEMPPDAQAQALENIRLVSNLAVQGNIHADRTVGGSNNNALAQKFRIPNGPNYILGNVTIRVKNRGTHGIKATIRAGSGNNPGTVLYTLNTPASPGTGNQVYTAPPGTLLEANKSYFVMLEGEESTGTSSKVLSTASTDDNGVAGWSISNNFRRRNNGWSGVSSSAIQIKVNGHVAPAEVPLNWALKPSGLVEGNTFRLIFLSSTKRNGSPTNIDVYNTFVQNRAAAGHAGIQAYSPGFRAVGCTDTVDATANTDTAGTGVPIYWLNGSKAVDEYEDFYDGDWDRENNNQDRNESGVNGTDTSVSDNFPLTGCGHDGTMALNNTDSRALGNNGLVRVGRPGSSTAGHGPIAGDDSTTDNTAMRPMYGLSEVFVVSGVNASTDATLSALAMLGSTGSETIDLSPTFASGTIAYTASVAHRIDSVTMTATKNDSNAVVVITDDDNSNTPDQAVLDLTVGSNSLTVTVAAENGSTQTYTITILRDAAPPAPTDCPVDTTWCTTMAVGYSEITASGIRTQSYGYQAGSNHGDLGSTTFPYGVNTYNVSKLAWIKQTMAVVSDDLSIHTDLDLPDGTVFQAGSQTFTVGADSDTGTSGNEEWDVRDSPPNWTAGQHVTVSLKLPALSTDASLSGLTVDDGTL